MYRWLYLVCEAINGLKPIFTLQHDTTLTGQGTVADPLSGGIVEYITGTTTPTGLKFRIVKYDDGTLGWEEL